MLDPNGFFIYQDRTPTFKSVEFPEATSGLATSDGEITEVTETFLPNIAEGSTVGATGQKSDIPGHPDPNLSVICQRVKPAHFIAVKIEDLGPIPNEPGFTLSGGGALLLSNGGKLLRSE